MKIKNKKKKENKIKLKYKFKPNNFFFLSKYNGRKNRESNKE